MGFADTRVLKADAKALPRGAVDRRVVVGVALALDRYVCELDARAVAVARRRVVGAGAVAPAPAAARRVVPAQSNITIAAGAVGAKTSEEFGINLVQIDLSKCIGRVHLHHREAGGRSWTIAPVEVHAPDGQWPLESLPSDLRKFAPSVTPAPVLPTTRSDLS